MKAIRSFSVYILFGIGIAFLSQASLAQIDQRAWSLSTNFEVWHRDAKGEDLDKHLFYAVGLQGNLFIAKNLSAILGVKREKSEWAVWSAAGDEEYGSDKEITTVFIQSGKYWFLGKTLALYVQAGYGFGMGRDKISNPTFSNTAWLNAHEISIKPGIFFFPLNRLALEMNLGNLAVNQTSRRPEFQSKTYNERSYTFKLAPVLNIGVHFFIGER